MKSLLTSNLLPNRLQYKISKFWDGSCREVTGLHLYGMKNNKGYSLIELFIVVAILGLIAGIGVPAYRSHLEKAKIVTAVAEIKMINTHIEAYRTTKYELPADLSDIGYQDFLDPWGNPYQYVNLLSGGSAGLGSSFALAKKKEKVSAREKRHTPSVHLDVTKEFFSAENFFRKQPVKNVRETIINGKIKTIPNGIILTSGGNTRILKTYSPTYNKNMMPIGLPSMEDGLILLARGKGKKSKGGGGDPGGGDTGGGSTSGGSTGGGSTGGGSTGGGSTGGGSTGGGSTGGGSTGGSGLGPVKGKQTAKGSPLNNDFDLYSMGRDGKTHWKVTQKHSQDDIIRGNNGSFIGPVSHY